MQSSLYVDSVGVVGASVGLARGEGLSGLASAVEWASNAAK